MEEKLTLVIIPTYNEKDNVTPLTEKVLSYPENVHILIVDDNSPDGTGKIADHLSSQNSRIHVLHRNKKQGLGRAYIAGFKWALKNNYEFVMEMDCDFSHNPKEIANFLKKNK